MSGPQSWDEMKSGIARRKEVIRKRNRQIDNLKGDLKKFKDHFEGQKKLIYAMRQVAIDLLLELTEDEADMSGEGLEKEIDRRIYLQCEANEKNCKHCGGEPCVSFGADDK